MTELAAPITGRPKWQFRLLAALLMAILVLGSLVVAEFVARLLEPQGISSFNNQPDKTLGWLPTPGVWNIKTEEFDTSITVNALHMNDREWTADDGTIPNRILAVGDSHTFAVGASPQQTWPKRTEAALFAGPGEGVVMNAGVIGYSLGQYLLRYRQLRETIQPTSLLVGVSMATDFYDLIPPEHGGFIYGGDSERTFFDLGSNGNLIERVYTKPVGGTGVQPVSQPDQSQLLRNFLGQFALYRRLKRSGLAMKVAMYYQPGGKSLMPGMDTVLKKELNSEDAYRWQLAEAIIAQLAKEARERGTRVILVNIPYLSQVYDSIWEDSFGTFPERYDRTLGSTRLAELCARHGVELIDTTQAFIQAARQRGQWLHWPVDGHPNPEGHQLIADVVANALKQPPTP